MHHLHRPAFIQAAGFALFVAGTAFCADTQPRNAILFIGDGMGLAQVTAGRIYKGNARDGKLTLDTLQHTALVRTYCVNSMVTDSAAAGTALAAGVKTQTGVIGKNAKGEDIQSALARAKTAGKSVGVVTTTTITHATPACFYAHVPLRADEEEIARQLIDYAKVDVAFGGGRQFFLPTETVDEESGQKCSRKDGADLISRAREIGYRVIQKQSEFDEVAGAVGGGKDPGKLLGLFNYGMLNFELERPGDKWGEPSLAQMTDLAIKILRRNPKGYFLMVEGGRIDLAAHANEGQKMVGDMVAFDDAIKVGLDSQPDPADTLIIITADHETAGLAINGYPPINISGRDLFTQPRAAGQGDIITFASGPGAERAKFADMPKSDLGYKQPSLMLASMALHTGVDVIAWGAGPGSEAIHGTLDNTDIAKIIMLNLRLIPTP